MNDLLNSLPIKNIFAVLTLFILTRILGKRQISQLTFFDYIVGISIGSIAAEMCIDENVSWFDGIVSMIIWTAFPLSLSFFAKKSINARKLLEGTPEILIQNGKIVEKNLNKSKFTINDLLEELRAKDVFNIEDVEFALLETNGKISVLKKSHLQTVTNSDLGLSVPYQGLCANVIIDGKLMLKNISMLDINEAWIFNELEKQNISSIEDVLFACYSTNGNLHIDLKKNDPKVLNVLL